MDYGPFGFMQRFSKTWNMWVGGGTHYGFLNQPLAGHRNFFSFANAIKNLLDEDGVTKLNALVQQYPDRALSKVSDVWTSKMGLTDTTEDSHQLAKGFLELMEDSQADYTMFWREMSKIPPIALTTEGIDDAVLTKPFAGVFYKPLSDKHKKRLGKLLVEWVEILKQEQGRTVEHIVQQMNSTNPKYVPREHLLVEAYTAAEKGDYAPIKNLQAVFSRPYDEQPEMVQKYYQQAPADTYHGNGKGGQAHMT